jgi:methylated-DNA-[protein]-cysteine S-methyltransferase
LIASGIISTNCSDLIPQVPRAICGIFIFFGTTKIVYFLMTFAEKVYEQLRQVPKGKVTTYKNLATALGTKAYRAVGSALKNNPDAPQVPCHRVVRSDGKVGGFMGLVSGEEVAKKIVMLRNEGVEIVGGRIDLEKYLA